MTRICDDQPIRVVIVDDHPAMRQGTQMFLNCSTGIQVVGTAGDGASALRLIKELQPDVLILDLRLPDLSGLSVAQQVRMSFPDVGVLILTGYDEVGYVQALLQLGVQGYLHKTVTSEELVVAVQAVANGRTMLEVAPSSLSSGNGIERFTTREYEVLRLLAAGQRNNDIAAALGVSVKTVEFHVSRILEKLAARSRADAICKALQQGILLLEASRERMC